MERAKTILLKIAVCIIGITVLALCIFWLPWQANVLAKMYPEFAYLQYPLLIGLYVTAIPFFFALYQAFRLLNYIDNDIAFSKLSVKALRKIQYCAITICFLYVAGFILLTSQNASNPGILLIGLIIAFSSGVIAVFTAVLQKLLKNALDIKSENDLTV
ncbi:DUF2975 domain-containing protein [Radiobacillus deserti]|uniref:DUF2975 domain-containing protein n=1 Tax=Radiobacillus deserti TaxID=2594883 RepID=A0A516KL13_9BACI|nr:DUF2975 domain-containing protein [Radiobacillus deserti]QDP42084.1 DUF2975 domain-containing protein [Radiobacillus deserti]